MLRRSWAGTPFDHHGEHYHVERGGLARPLDPAPTLYFGGASPAAEQVAARHADVVLMWGEPPHAVAEAWAVADRLLAGMDPARVEAAQRRFARYDSVGQRRMVDLHAGSSRDLEIHPGLWAGVGLVREGAGTALVGSYAEVAALLRQYAEGGVSEFVLSGWPHLEEAYRVGEYVLPRLAPVPG
ncbi:alkanesulfonate monooxygenase [Nonomuraea wenchangensis]|uniref:Alkanesulfonate monooxygenase n=1 Tax=Nonomuraea wenchangensis TaxID=568860 RepID=A0A1I0KI45_9ACTN|nr:alkanesulfonate monooxygenase [Nonomuraea wenchangensis]